MEQPEEPGLRADIGSSALVADLIGDLNRVGITAVPLKALVSLGEDLGIPVPTMRVTLARLRTKGWFDVERDGRESTYRISRLAKGIFAEAARRTFHPPASPWSGDWSMVIYTVPDSDRAARDELRRRLAWHGFGPLAPATWISPHPRLDDIAERSADLPSARLTLLTTRTSGLPADRALAARAWDLEELGQAYEEFVRTLRMRVSATRVADLSPSERLAERIELVFRFRRLAREDPQLPDELQPPGWMGDEAYRLFRARHDALAEDAETQLRARLGAQRPD